jgi:hypothetical protein
MPMFDGRWSNVEEANYGGSVTFDTRRLEFVNPQTSGALRQVVSS